MLAGKCFTLFFYHLSPECISGSTTQMSTAQAQSAGRAGTSFFANAWELRLLTGLRSSKGTVLVRGKSHDHCSDKCSVSWATGSIAKVTPNSKLPNKNKTWPSMAIYLLEGEWVMAERFSVQDSPASRRWDWTECGVVCIWWSLCRQHSHGINISTGNPGAVL